MGETLIFGHRGSRGTHPENTLLSFEHTCKLGAEGIELDVRMTKDHELVVIHDETIDRTTNGTGHVGDFTLQELQTYSAGSEFKKFPLYTSAWDQEKVPTLAEVFERLADYPIQINIELKTYDANYPNIEEKTMDLVKHYQLQSRVVYSSFDLKAVQRVKALDSDANVAYLALKSLSDVKHIMTDNGFSALHLSPIILTDGTSAEDIQEVPIRIWTINPAEQIKQSLALGFEAIITDYPEMALEIKKNFSIR